MNSYHCQFYEFIHPLYNMNSYPLLMIWIHILSSYIVWIHTPTPAYEFISFVWIQIFKSIPATPTITHMESSIGHSPSVTVHYELPYSWEKKFDPCGRAFYIDHNTKSTTLERPLPPIEDHCKQNDATDNCIVASVNNLLRLTSDLNGWTSKFVITHGDHSIDVSSAAQGDLSSSPSGC